MNIDPCCECRWIKRAQPTEVADLTHVSTAKHYRLMTEQGAAQPSHAADVTAHLR
ncbi:MAG: hypothetical protein IH600_07540 [Bacteroidetes bacterium]|nr:hypothetical protein [Bacteroidota bacterium]